MPDNKDELRKRISFIVESLAKKVDSLNYQSINFNKKVRLEAKDRTEKLVTDYNRNQLKSLKAKLPEKYNATSNIINKMWHDGFDAAIDQVNNLIDELIGE